MALLSEISKRINWVISVDDNRLDSALALQLNSCRHPEIVCCELFVIIIYGFEYIL